MSDPLPLQVLIIEDDVDTQANLQDILELDEHRVVAESSVAGALNRSDLATISVVVLDRRLPDGNAEDLIPRVRLAMPSADIIVVTGHADVESAILALRRGASDYILKPINPDILRASLGRTAKQIELRKAKERSEANFRELIEAVDFLVIIVNHRHEIIYSNRYANELTGYESVELLGQHVTRFLTAESAARVERQLERMPKDQRAEEDEVILVRRTGEERWVVWNVRTLKDFEGAEAILCVGQDITERRRLEQRALQAERLAAIGQMVTGLAHESRNALQRSQASLEVLQDELSDQPDALELVEQVQRAQQHLHKLYEEVRSYAAPIALRRESCHIDEIWRETWAHLTITRGDRGIQLVEVISTGDLTCQADPLALEQVFRNILENAIHVSPRAGTIEVRAAPATLFGRPAVEVVIQDQGPGLNAEQAIRIFEPFYTTKTQGTGLGMAIVKRIVEAHGGQLEARNSNGGGAAIAVTLPITAGTSSSARTTG